MSPCLNVSDLTEITDQELKQTVEVANSPETQRGGCAKFAERVRSLESVLMLSYKIVAMLARRAEGPKEMSDLWQAMIGICDAILKTLLHLKQLYPDCGTVELYDLALDYKNAAYERHAWTRDAHTWTKNEALDSLFPAAN